MKTTEEKAKAYTDSTDTRVFGSEETLDATDLIQKGYIAGATEALSGQWRNVEDELPDGTPFCVTMADEESRLCLCHFDGDVFIEDYSGLVCAVKYWMPIPEPHKDESE